ncbi:peptide/nickel transport system permease protein [Rossellomorea marisflavi]
MKRIPVVLTKISNLIIGIFGIIFLGSLPQLFQNTTINFSSYISSLSRILKMFIGFEPFTYENIGVSRNIFPQIFHHFFESSLILFSSLIIAGFTSLIVVYFYFFVNNKCKTIIRTLVSLLEGIPDVLLIVFTQLIVILFYKKTGIIFANLATTEDTRAWILPVICLSIPTFLMYLKLMILRFSEELTKDYVVLAKSKGISFFQLLNRHVLRNVIISFGFYMKHNLWFILSNMFIVEILFNVSGISTFIRDYPTTEVFTVSLILIFIPIYIIYQLLDLIIPNEWRSI